MSGWRSSARILALAAESADVQGPGARNPGHRLRHGPFSNAGRSRCKRIPNQYWRRLLRSADLKFKEAPSVRSDSHHRAIRKNRDVPDAHRWKTGPEPRPARAAIGGAIKPDVSAGIKSLRVTRINPQDMDRKSRKPGLDRRERGAAIVRSEQAPARRSSRIRNVENVDIGWIELDVRRVAAVW